MLVRIPAGVAHGYRPLTNPCALLYFVTETFDPAKPDEFRSRPGTTPPSRTSGPSRTADSASGKDLIYNSLSQS